MSLDADQVQQQQQQQQQQRGAPCRQDDVLARAVELKAAAILVLFEVQVYLMTLLLDGRWLACCIL